MEESVFSKFISADAERIHREHLKTLKHKYSILRKSIPALAGVEMCEVERVRLSAELRQEVYPLLMDIRLHELYFNSFTELAPPSVRVRATYGSESAFLYEMLEAARRTDGGFICVGRAHRGVSIFVADKHTHPSALADVMLALDISEHAYFLDYGFDREAYARHALPYLDLSLVK